MNPFLGKPIANIKAKLPEKLILKGTYARIEPLNAEKYYDSMYEATKNPKLWAYVTEEPPSSLEEYRTYLKNRELEEWRISYLIFAADGTVPLGIFSFMKIELVHRSVEIGYVMFSEALQKTRIATQVLYLTARCVFQELGFVRYQWTCNDLNTPSRNAALRFGFSLEGEFKNNRIRKGHLGGTAYFSMLVEQWAEIKKEYQRWLSPQNFDENREQKTKLTIKSQRVISKEQIN